MSIFDRFRLNKKSSAQIAKERLQIIVAHESTRAGKAAKGLIDLHELQQKLIDVISDYLNIEKAKVKVELERDQDRSILELNVILPDRIDTETAR